MSRTVCASLIIGAACLSVGCVTRPPLGEWAHVTSAGFFAISVHEDGRCGVVEVAVVPGTGRTGAGTWCTYAVKGTDISISHIAGEALPSPILLERATDGLSILASSGEPVTLRRCPQKIDAMAPNSRLLSDACESALRASPRTLVA